ncbi:hypothetical protein D8674_003909 [Pyrus ussuriensis x Pyrus communis]|uniref:Uncharacterized protein n=1 Tax=Pyrus ussuriensis x Pyrus communis TaxID=2448454 RepID=A0A5N5FX92_9ROSA|nr:hypothetical protein D8674_003909 [Pyrus ussuriensis x Pyrus communis]
MVNFGGPSSKRVQGRRFWERYYVLKFVDKKKKRAPTCVRYTYAAKSHYRIIYVELVGYEKSDMVKKFRGEVQVLERDSGVNWASWRDVPKEIKTVTINALAVSNLIKCIDIMFKYRFWELKFDVECDVERQ